MSKPGKPCCPHCARKISKGLENFCPHCGNSTQQRLSKSFISECDPTERERQWNAAMAPFITKAQRTPEPELDPIEVEDRWDDVAALAAPDLATQAANFNDFVGQLARAIKDRPAEKAHAPAERQWSGLTRAEKAALRPPRLSNASYANKYDHGQAGN